MRVEVDFATGDTTEEPDWVPPAPPLPELNDYRVAIQYRIDATASEKQYENGVACASYAVSTIPDWATQAQAFVAWRDAVWAYAFGEMGKIEGGTRPQPTVDELISELPVMEWPE